MPSCSSLLTLPAELRNHIFEDIAHNPTGPIGLNISLEQFRLRFLHHTLALAYVCRQTSAEYLSFLHQAVVHDTVPLHIDVLDADFAGLTKFLQSLAPLTEGKRRDCQIMLHFNTDQATDEKPLVGLLHLLDTSTLMSAAAMKRSYTAKVEWNVSSSADAEVWATSLGASLLFPPDSITEEVHFGCAKYGICGDR